jgi:hypothetical protein
MTTVSDDFGEKFQQGFSKWKRVQWKMAYKYFLLTSTGDKREAQTGEYMRQKS